MILAGRARLVPGDDIDTDALLPGRYLDLDDPQALRAHLFEGLDPALRDGLGRETVLVAGRNFGTGSSREHVQIAMAAWGVRCVVAHDFARVFLRNCINRGIAAVASPGAAAAAREGSEIRADLALGTVSVDGRRYGAGALSRDVRDLLEAGGLVPWARARLEATP